MRCKLKLQPQALFKPQHLIMPVKAAASLLGMTESEFKKMIASGSRNFVLVSSSEGEHVEFHLKGEAGGGR